MNEKVAKLLNEQITHEFYSAYLYLDFANYYASVGLDGFENWYRIQAQEEQSHAMLFYQYLHNNGEKVTLGAIKQPDKVLKDHMDPLKAGLEHEKLVDWFVKEQGEEEKNAADMITKMELFGGDSKGLYMLNSELKDRVYSEPSLTL